MEEMDDFGDLYAEVGIDVNTASTVSKFRRTYGTKAVEDDFVRGVPSHCNGDEIELNEESILYGRIRGVDDFGGSRTVGEVTEPAYVEDGCSRGAESVKCEEGNASYGVNVATEQTTAAEREVGRLTDCVVGNARNQKGEEAETSSLSQYSDSEDDLHIVLNEDDGCYLQPTSMFRSGRPRGVASHVEDDNLVIVMGAETPDKDQKWVEDARSPPGTNDGGAERHKMSKNGGSFGGTKQYQNSQYSLYKYVRQRSAGFANRHSVSQGEVGHGDTKIASCRSESVAPSVCEFFLPRNKTIFDVDIDSLEKKPWRYSEVDITDFFNFDMDEESWKSYCTSVAQYREQTTMRMRIPVYESVPGSTDSEAVRGEFGTLNKEPKGRSIQVEDGTGGRLPSMDVRRPRVRDADVVIQVILQEEVQASQDTHKENIRPSDGSFDNESPGRKAYEMESKLLGCSHNSNDLNPSSSVPACVEDTRPCSMPSVPACGRSQCSTYSSKRSGISHLERYSGEDSAHNKNHSDEQGKSHLSGNNRKRDIPKGTMEDDERKGDASSKSEHNFSQNESVFSDQTIDDSRHGHVERHPRSENGSFIEVEKMTSSGEHHYISPPDQLDERLDSSRDCHSIELKNKRSKIESSRNRGHLKFQQKDKTKCNGRSTHRSTVRSKMPMEDRAFFSRDSSSIDLAIHSEIMEGKVDFCSSHEKRSLVYYGDIEESNKPRRKSVEGCRRGNAYPLDICNGKDPRSLDVGAERNVAIRGCTCGDNVMEAGRKGHQRAWMLERGTKSSCVSGRIPDEECNRSGVECLSSGNRKQRYGYLKYECEIRTGTDLNDVVSRKRRKEEVVGEGYKDYMSYPDRGMEKYWHDMRSNKCKSQRGWEIDEATRMHPCKRDLYSPDQRQSNTIRSKIISENRSTEDGQSIHVQKERIRERYWQADSRNLCYRKHQYEGLLIDRMKGHYHSSKPDSLAAANDWSRGDSGISRDSFFSENARNDWSKDAYNSDDDDDSSEYWHQDNRRGLCSYYSHEDAIFEHDDVKQHGFDGENVLGFGRLLSANGELWGSDLDLQINSFSDVPDEGKNYISTPLSCRESVKPQRNVWEEKFSRRYPRMGNLRRVSSDKERRAFRKLHELYADNEVSPWNSEVEDKTLSKVDSEMEKRLVHGKNNSCYRQKSMCLDKHLVKNHHEAEVLVPKDPAVEKYKKKEVMADKKEEVKKMDACTDVDQNNSRDKVLDKLHHEKGTDDNQSVPVEDNKRILEMLAKMEKRRERFKESVSLKKETYLDMHHVLNQESETGEVKQRPIRKRRWCGS